MQQDIVIFAPHQDDEILGAYEIIRQQPEHTYVVFLTNGDYEGAEVAKTRWHESRKALTHLGVPEDHMIALGYADTGMPREVSFLWRLWHEGDQTLVPSRVGAHTYHPDGGKEYHLAHWGAHAAYTRLAVLADVRGVLEDIRPGDLCDQRGRCTRRSCSGTAVCPCGNRSDGRLYADHLPLSCAWRR